MLLENLPALKTFPLQAPLMAGPMGRTFPVINLEGGLSLRP